MRRSRWVLDAVIEVKLVEQPALIASSPPHHRAASAPDTDQIAATTEVR